MSRLKGKNKSKARKKKRLDSYKEHESYKKGILAKILKWDEPALSEKCVLVKKDEDIHSLIKDMGRVIIFSKNGVGLAASQIGVTKRVIAVTLDKKNVVTAFINPEILIHSGDVIKSREMCLSFPNFECVIDRYDTITMRYEDIDRELHTKEFKGFNAIVLQHEVDHIDGVCGVGAEWKRLKTPPPVEEETEQEEYDEPVKVVSVSSETDKEE